MSTYILRDNDGNLRGQIKLPIRIQAYTFEEATQALQTKCINNMKIPIMLWVNHNEINDIAIKAYNYSDISTLLKSCCGRIGLDHNNYHLEHDGLILPNERCVGMFLSDNDKLKLVANNNSE